MRRVKVAFFVVELAAFDELAVMVEAKNPGSQITKPVETKNTFLPVPLEMPDLDDWKGPLVPFERILALPAIPFDLADTINAELVTADHDQPTVQCRGYYAELSKNEI